LVPVPLEGKGKATETSNTDPFSSNFKRRSKTGEELPA